jgi:hypothetical protein
MNDTAKIFLLSLLGVVIFLAFYFMLQEKDNSYKFPDDYIEVNCTDTFIGDYTDAICYQTKNLDSFILKTPNHYTIYSMEFYTEEKWNEKWDKI